MCCQGDTADVIRDVEKYMWELAKGAHLDMIHRVEIQFIRHKRKPSIREPNQ